MFHVEHSYRADANGFGDAQSREVYFLPAVRGAEGWFRNHDDSPCFYEFYRPLQGELGWTKPSSARCIK